MRVRACVCVRVCVCVGIIVAPNEIFTISCIYYFLSSCLPCSARSRGPGSVGRATTQRCDACLQHQPLFNGTLQLDNCKPGTLLRSSPSQPQLYVHNHLLGDHLEGLCTFGPGHRKSPIRGVKGGGCLVKRGA